MSTQTLELAKPVLLPKLATSPAPNPAPPSILAPSLSLATVLKKLQPKPGDFVRHASFSGLAKLVRIANGQAFVILFGRLIQVPASELESLAPGRQIVAASAEGQYFRAKEVTPSKAKGAKTTFQRFREDWSNDTSGWEFVHDAVNGALRRDAEAQEWTMADKNGRTAIMEGGAKTSKTTERSESIEALESATASEVAENAEMSNALAEAKGMTELQALDVVTIPLTADGRVTFTGNVEVFAQRPLPTLRELRQRASKRQKQILKALGYYKKGLNWDEVARVMGVKREIVRGWRQEIKAWIGEAEVTRDTGDQPRDPDTKRFSRRIEG